jgi:mannosyltransferase
VTAPAVAATIKAPTSPNAVPPLAAHDRTPRWILPVILLGAFALRLWHLGARSVWTDEGSTWTAATAPLHELIRLCAQKDASPPLFYLLTSWVMKLGDDEAHLRFVSALASVGLVWLTYRLARLFLGRGESTLAAALTALSPFQLMFGQEARTYTLVACLATGSLFLFLRAAVLGRKRAWIPYVVVSALALYTQNIALLSFGVQGAVILFHPDARRRLLPWVASLIAIVALYLPWAFISMTQMSHLSHSHWYLKRPDFHAVLQVLRAVFLSPIPLVTPDHTATLPGLRAFVPAPIAQLVLFALPGVPFLLAARRGIGDDARAMAVRLLMLALLLPLAAVFVVSFRTPLWLPRYFVLLTPALSVLTAIGIAELHPHALMRAWAGLFLLAQAYACIRYDTDYSKEPWRTVAHAIAEQAPPGRTAVLVPFDVDPFRFYNVKLGSPVTAIEVSHPAVPFADGYSPAQIDEMERAAARKSARYDEVWVVVRSPNSEVRRRVAAESERVAAAGRRETGRWFYDSFTGPLRVSRFTR